MSLQSKVQELIKEVSARRWLEYSKQFDQTTQDCMQDAVIAMVVVLNENHRAEHGSPALEKFLNMGLTELTEEIRRVLGDDDESAEVDDATFPIAGDDGGFVAGGMGADGPGAGLRAEPGPDLPVDGDPTV